MKRSAVSLFLSLLIPLLAGPALAQDHGGGGGGCGDVFGDLVHILRDDVTGQPILEKRLIELPEDLLDWGYCPVALDENGAEIPFVDLSCDPADPDAVVEVDYFGRLSGGRTKERNSRMHFDEVIETIRGSELVRLEVAGRLEFGNDCEPGQGGKLRCATWKVVDSPMENLALYTRLMKYGHLQTDPLEEDVWAQGDPDQGIQYHPALRPEDWAKFLRASAQLLPGGGSPPDPAGCFDDEGEFFPECAQPESLVPADFTLAAAFLAGAADKTGRMTEDLVQYTNRILKIPVATEHTAAAVDLLPALIRDCSAGECVIYPAEEGLPAPADELFVNFRRSAYERAVWRNKVLAVVEPQGDGWWHEIDDCELLGWLDFANGESPGKLRNIDGFVAAASDSLRTIEFIHNYEIPADLGWDFDS